MNKEVFSNNDKEIINKFVTVNDDTNLGYEIHTNKQVISFFISNQSGCCESWGAMTTEDTLDDFVNSELLSLATVAYDYTKHPLTIKLGWTEYSDEVGCIFIDVNTSVGKLQFVLYNCHNGYYGHSVNIKSKQLTMDACL